MQNFITIRLLPFAPQICENAHQLTRLVFLVPFLVLPTAYSQDPCTDFHDQHVKDVPFGGPENKILNFDLIFPQKHRKFSANFRRDKISRQKALTMGMLPCKLPLIVIVAQ